MSSGLLYSAAHGWVKTVLEADSFATSIEALNCCLRKDLENVQIRVHCNEGAGYDTIFSVTDFPARTKAPALS